MILLMPLEGFVFIKLLSRYNSLIDTHVKTLQNTESLGVDPNKIIIGGGSAGANLVSRRLAHFDNVSLTRQ